MKTITEIAENLGCDNSTLRYACIKGTIPASKIGNTWVIDDTTEQFTNWSNNLTPGKAGAKKKEIEAA